MRYHLRIFYMFLIIPVFVFSPSNAFSQPRPPIEKISFSQFSWSVRHAEEPQGPGSNYFGGRDLSVFTNPDGSVTLKLGYKEGIWYAAELTLDKRLGYGTYIFQIDTPLVQLDSNLVLGLFTYSRQSKYNHAEIDMEFSAWGIKNVPVLGQFVVQPYITDGNMKTFSLPQEPGPTSFVFTWLADRIEFAAWRGHSPQPDIASPLIFAHWMYLNVQNIPKPGQEYVHMNLYLSDGFSSPAGNGKTSVMIRTFTFIPAR